MFTVHADCRLKTIKFSGNLVPLHFTEVQYCILKKNIWIPILHVFIWDRITHFGLQL